MIVNLDHDEDKYWNNTLNKLFVEYNKSVGNTPSYTRRSDRIQNFCQYLNNNNILRIEYITESYTLKFRIEEDELLTLFLLKYH